MTQNLERNGFLIFFISIVMVSQLRWAESNEYNDIAMRLAAAIMVGLILNWVLKKWFESNVDTIKTEKWQKRISNISFSLSFSFLWVAFHENGHLGGGIVILLIIFLIKSNDKAKRWFLSFMKTKNFEVELDETKELPVVLVKGKHDPNNLVAFQYLCVDLSEIFFEMKTKKFKEAKLSLNVTDATNEKMLQLILAIAENHGIELNTFNDSSKT
tara:strand:- start:936 stop:1577 length:642 start_codon:yes stop_codon:yes gene_type:complete